MWYRRGRSRGLCRRLCRGQRDPQTPPRLKHPLPLPGSWSQADVWGKKFRDCYGASFLTGSINQSRHPRFFVEGPTHKVGVVCRGRQKSPMCTKGKTLMSVLLVLEGQLAMCVSVLAWVTKWEEIKGTEQSSRQRDRKKHTEMWKVVFCIIVTPSAKQLYFVRSFCFCSTAKPRITQRCHVTDCFLCLYVFANFFSHIYFQQFGKILDVEIIFNERGSKVSVIFASQNMFTVIPTMHIFPLYMWRFVTWCQNTTLGNHCPASIKQCQNAPRGLRHTLSSTGFEFTDSPLALHNLLWCAPQSPSTSLTSAVYHRVLALWHLRTAQTQRKPGKSSTAHWWKVVRLR